MPWPGAMASWLLMESMPMGSYPGLFLFIESWVFMALDVFHELLSFQESIYSWDSVSWNLAIPGLFLFIESTLFVVGMCGLASSHSLKRFYSMPWPGAMASWLLMESMAMGLYPGFILFMI